MTDATVPKLNQQTAGPGNARRRWMCITLFGVGVLAAGLVLWTATMRPRASDRWMEAMRARGEVFTLEELGLDRLTKVDPVLDTLLQAASRLQVLKQAAVAEPHRGLLHETDRVVRVGWMEPRLYSSMGRVLDWEVATRLADELGPVVKELHTTLREPPRDPGMDYRTGVVGIPVYWQNMVQSLGELVLVELRRHNLAAVHANLLAMFRVARVHDEAWAFMHQRNRAILVGLAVDSLWHALQAPGWTDAQLEELQRELEQVRFLTCLPRVFEVERAIWLRELDRYLQEGPSSLGGGWRNTAAPGTPALLESAAYLAWRFGRSGRDRKSGLQTYQEVIDRHRQIAAGVPLLKLKASSPPVENWWSRSRLARDLFPFSSARPFERATETLAVTDLWRRLAIVATALERYRLGNGHYPETLEELVPGLIEELPHDPISGQPLCYRRESETRFALASDWFDAPEHPALETLIWPRAAPDPPASPQSAGDEICPHIQFWQAPLHDVIKVLTRHMELDVTFHPAVTAELSWGVDYRAENVSYRHALNEILTWYGLRLEEGHPARPPRVTRSRSRG